MPDFVVGHSSFTPHPPDAQYRPRLTIRAMNQHARFVALLAEKIGMSVEDLLRAPEEVVKRLRYEAP